MAQVLANLFGIGGGTYISRLLGARRENDAVSASCLSFYSALCSAALYSLLTLVFTRSFALLLGADDENVGYTCVYLRWVLGVGAVPTVLSMMLSHLVRAEGDGKNAGIGISLGGIIHIVLDPLLIMPWGLNMQIEGAAVSTAISNGVAMLYYIVCLMKKKGTLISLSPSQLRFDISMLADIIRSGLPAATQTLLAAISNGFLNSVAAEGARRLGETSASAAVAAMGIAKKVDMLPMNIAMGMSQGILPLLSFNYASANFRRMRGTARSAISFVVGVSLLWIVVMELFPRQVVSLFIGNDATVEYGIYFLRIGCITTPALSLGYLITAVFQAAGLAKGAFVLSMLRKGPLDIPLMFAANSLFPLFGLVWVQPIVDHIAAVISIIMYRRFIKNLGRESQPMPSTP